MSIEDPRGLPVFHYMMCSSVQSVRVALTINKDDLFKCRLFNLLLFGQCDVILYGQVHVGSRLHLTIEKNFVTNYVIWNEGLSRSRIILSVLKIGVATRMKTVKRKSDFVTLWFWQTTNVRVFDSRCWVSAIYWSRWNYFFLSKIKSHWLKTDN